MRIKEEELPQSWADMESYIDKNPKKFGYSDPNGGSSGNAFIQRALVYIMVIMIIVPIKSMKHRLLIGRKPGIGSAVKKMR